MPKCKHRDLNYEENERGEIYRITCAGCGIEIPIAAWMEEEVTPISHEN